MTTAYDLIHNLVPLETYRNHLLNDLKKITIKGMADNSEDIKENYLFFALKGLNNKSHTYLKNALKNKANLILLEGNNALENKELNYHYYDNVPVLILNDLKKKIHQISSQYYQNKTEQKNIYAVTGTNGKTSVAHFITQLLQLNQIKTGYIGTLGYGNLKKFKPLGCTTPAALKIEQIIHEFHQKEINHIAMEVSSHALSQCRTSGLNFKLVTFTNITQDHFDYHKVFENYLNAKLSIFDNHLVENSLIFEDKTELYQQIIHKAKQNSQTTLTYGINCGDICIEKEHTKYFEDKIETRINSPWGKATIELNLLSSLNILNVIPAIYTLILEGFSFQQACEQLSNIRSVKGRMQKYKNIIIDYSHTPDSLEKALQEIRFHYPNRELEVIFGCGGNRDTSKRHLMGNIAFKNADSLIITEDNPRDEDNKQITSQITEQIQNESDFKEKVTIINQRQEAIEHSLQNNDTEKKVILIAGKGHESTIEKQGKKLFFSEIKFIREFYKNEN